MKFHDNFEYITILTHFILLQHNKHKDNKYLTTFPTSLRIF